MKEKTTDLKRRISALSLEDKFKVLKNVYRGEECYIVGCGPSIRGKESLIREKLKNKLVISIKQAYNFLDDSTDFHAFNYVHYEPYQYKVEPIVLELTRFGQVLSKEPDLPVPINVRTAGRYQHSVVAAQSFDQNTFAKTILRPFGPGIMFEVCFFLAVHLGATGITTLGFDVAKLTSHFYGPDEKVSDSKQKILDKEQADVLAGLKSFADWLDRVQCPLKIISPINPADKSIQRLTIEDIP